MTSPTDPFCNSLVFVRLFQGPRMVRDVFRMARENAPSIIFIDEVDAIATKRFDAQTGADREVQRILLELLNQMDGFDQGSNVKVSVCEDVVPEGSWWDYVVQASTSLIFLWFTIQLYCPSGHHGYQPTRHPRSGALTSRSTG